MSENEKGPFENLPVIFSYSRARAIEDGVLVDLTEWSRQTGFKVPVACTSAVWKGYVVPPERTRDIGQCERGRAHDLLWMMLNAIRRNPDTDRLLFKVIFLMSPRRHRTVTLKAICGPGDDGEPVITVTMPDED